MAGRSSTSGGKVKPLRLLFIGNSFTSRNDLPGILTRLAAAAKPPTTISIDSVIANGMSLRAHWNKGTAAGLIRQGKWDYVVLQEQSTLPLKNRTRFHENVRLFDPVIQESGARMALYMTWARRSEFDRQGELSEAYQDIGRELDAIVVPVGSAWQRVLAGRPDLVLHDRDGSHPNLVGSYLAACVFFATLLGRSPVGLITSEDAELSRIGADVPSVLQRVARDPKE